MKLSTCLIFVTFFMSAIVDARTDCPSAKVVHIQIEGNNIIYKQENAPWRGLGAINNTGTKERYSALLAAQVSGRKVLVGYNNNSYDCNVMNYSEPAYVVRTFNQ